MGATYDRETPPVRIRDGQGGGPVDNAGCLHHSPGGSTSKPGTPTNRPGEYTNSSSGSPVGQGYWWG